MRTVLKLSYILPLLILSLFSSTTDAQTSEHSEKEETFKIYGNCRMCQLVIEKAANGVDGVIHANWNSETKQMNVEYDYSKTSSEDIKKAVAAVGYDSEEYRAEDNIYNKLHGCCQYERPSAIK